MSSFIHWNNNFIIKKNDELFPLEFNPKKKTFLTGKNSNGKRTTVKKSEVYIHINSYKEQYYKNEKGEWVTYCYLCKTETKKDENCKCENKTFLYHQHLKNLKKVRQNYIFRILDFFKIHGYKEKIRNLSFSELNDLLYLERKKDKVKTLFTKNVKDFDEQKELLKNYLQEKL